MKAWIKLGIVFVVALLVAAWLSTAKADVLRGDKGSCSHFSQVIQNFGDFKEAGATWSDLETIWAQMVADALNNEGSYVQTTDDAEWVTQKAKGLWETKDPAVLYAANVYEECMRIPKMKRKVML